MVGPNKEKSHGPHDCGRPALTNIYLKDPTIYIVEKGKVKKIRSGIEPIKVGLQRFRGPTSSIEGLTGI